MDDANLAASLYDHPTSAPASIAPAAKTAVAPDPDTAAAERMFGEKEAKPFESTAPAEVKALREAMPERKMFSAQQVYATDLPEALFEASIGMEGPDGTAISQEQAVQAAREWREVAADLELPAVEVRELVNIFKAERPTPEQQTANRAASFKWLREAHGDRADFALRAAQALVARDPRVAALLDHNGAGDDLRVVQKVVTSALRQVTSGRLKVAKK